MLALELARVMEGRGVEVRRQTAHFEMGSWQREKAHVEGVMVGAPMVVLSIYILAALDFIANRFQANIICSRARGVVVSHLLRIWKALGSNPSVSMFGLAALTWPCCNV